MLGLFVLVFGFSFFGLSLSLKKKKNMFWMIFCFQNCWFLIFGFWLLVLLGLVWFGLVWSGWGGLVLFCFCLFVCFVCLVCLFGWLVEVEVG